MKAVLLLFLFAIVEEKSAENNTIGSTTVKYEFNSKSIKNSANTIKTHYIDNKELNTIENTKHIIFGPDNIGPINRSIKIFEVTAPNKINNASMEKIDEKKEKISINNYKYIYNNIDKFTDDKIKKESFYDNMSLGTKGNGIAKSYKTDKKRNSIEKKKVYNTSAKQYKEFIMSNVKGLETSDDFSSRNSIKNNSKTSIEKNLKSELKVQTSKDLELDLNNNSTLNKTLNIHGLSIKQNISNLTPKPYEEKTKFLDYDLDLCYDISSGDAIKCQPDFENILLGRTFKSIYPSCSVHHFDGSVKEANDKIDDKTLKDEIHHDNTTRNKKCLSCEKENQNRAVSYLTDSEVSKNETCWIASPKGNVAELRMNLNKKYEFNFMSFKFCSESQMPEMMTIWKSVLSPPTRKWRLLKIFSRNCSYEHVAFYFKKQQIRLKQINNKKSSVKKYKKKILQKKADNILDNTRSYLKYLYHSNSDEDDNIVPFNRRKPYYKATCSEINGEKSKLSFSNRDIYINPLSSTVSSTSDPDLEPALAEWMTIYQMRIFLYGNSKPIKQEYECKQQTGTKPQNIINSSLTSLPEETPFNIPSFAISNINIGGRCKCNGHGSTCIEGDQNDPEPRCLCRHNTRGRDCERCKPLYQDVPWRRATHKQPNECVACNCNNHASRCSFNRRLYSMSSHPKSGGVCLKCAHNTAGRFCHLCRNGYYRTPGKSLADRNACSPCNCHMMGSYSRGCNRSTGQCKCKRHVTGRACNSCAPGFTYVLNTSSPCVEINSLRNRASPGTDLCSSYCRPGWKLDTNIDEKICQSDYVVLQAKVLEKQLKAIRNRNTPTTSYKYRKNYYENWIKYKILVNNVFNKKNKIEKNFLKYNNLQNSAKLRRRMEKIKSKKPKSYEIDRNSIKPGTLINLWTKIDLVKQCSCIHLDSGKSYFMSLPMSRKRKNIVTGKRENSKHYINLSGRMDVGVIKLNLGANASNIMKNELKRINVNKQGSKEDDNKTNNYIEYDVNRKVLKFNKIKINPKTNKTINIKKAKNRFIAKRSLQKQPLQNDKEMKTFESIKFTSKLNNKNNFGYKRNGQWLRDSKSFRKFSNNFPQTFKLSREARRRKVISNNLETLNGKRRKVKMNMMLGLESVVWMWGSKETKSIFNRLTCF